MSLFENDKLFDMLYINKGESIWESLCKVISSNILKERQLKRWVEYLYEYIGEATHSESREKMVVYRALYGDKGLYVRPYEMFVGEVDHEKYPEIRQKYRFEKIWV